MTPLAERVVATLGERAMSTNELARALRKNRGSVRKVLLRLERTREVTRIVPTPHGGKPEHLFALVRRPEAVHGVDLAAERSAFLARRNREFTAALARVRARDVRRTGLRPIWCARARAL